MAKPSPNSLIHCASCGEDYSATYKRCPFCGAKNAPAQSDPDRPAASSDLDDTYVFDGQGLFDDTNEEDGASHPKGGKRLAEKSLANPFAGADINWPRMITFICSLVIIAAAMVIVFTWIYPQLRGSGDPVSEGSQSPSSPATDPVGGATESPDPNATDPVTAPTDDVPPAGPAELTTISFNRENDADFTLSFGESHTITLRFDPADWSGTVTWASTDTRYATVDANGKVTNVNTTGQLRLVTITASAEGLILESKVYCKGTAAATEPPATDAPTQSPSGSDTVAGKTGTVIKAASGLNVRSGPGTSYSKIGSLSNGQTVSILEDAGNGWYKISYGSGEGYINGNYVSIK